MKSIDTIKKISLVIILSFIFSASSVFAQNDTLYIYENGSVVYQKAVKEIDSVLFYKPMPVKDTAGTFTDTRDGNEYKWVKIGDQVWMAENLKYLPSVVAGGTGSSTTPYYYVYSYNGTDVAKAKEEWRYNDYGVLYNWNAAMGEESSSNTNPSNVQGVCPTGWHLPSDAEWSELVAYLDGANVAGEKLKDDELWDGTNETGFSAISGGIRLQSGSFYYSSIGFYWTSAQSSYSDSYYRSMSSGQTSVNRTTYDKRGGLSVRCIKD